MRHWVGAIQVCALVLVMGVLNQVGLGSQLSGVGSASKNGHGAHSWLVVEETGGNWRLVHLPPRGFGQGAASAGRLMPAANLESPPIALAASGARVYLFYQGASKGASEGESLGDPQRVRVYSIEAVPVMGGVWAFEPEGRFESYPSLQTTRAVLGAAVDAEGRPLVLVAEDSQPPTLFRLNDEGWSEGDGVGLPASSSIAFFGSQGTAPAVVLRGDSPGVWVYDSSKEAFSEAFSRIDDRVKNAGSVHLFGKRIVWTQRVKNGLEVWSSVGEESHRVALVDRIGGPVRVAPVRVGGGRLVILSRVDPDKPGSEFELIEVSLATGEILYRGAPLRASPVTAGEFRMLAALLSLFLVVVLVLTFRPGLDPSAIVIPEGTALAEPGRRLVATGIDFLIATLIASNLFGVDFSSLVTGLVFLESGTGWIAVPGTMVIGGAMGSVFEALFAWTPGKLLTGCRVVRLGSTPSRLSLVRSIQRNAVKWVTPPIAAMAMLDPQTRHRGDDLARAVVVIQGQPAPPDPGSSDA